MATESVATESTAPRLLPVRLIDESDKIIYQSRAILELLCDARAVMDSPEDVLDGVTWLLRDHLARLNEICRTRAEVAGD